MMWVGGSELDEESIWTGGRLKVVDGTEGDVGGESCC